VNVYPLNTNRRLKCDGASLGVPCVFCARLSLLWIPNGILPALRSLYLRVRSRSLGDIKLCIAKLRPAGPQADALVRPLISDRLRAGG